jgi:hypothetical protein
VMHLVLLDTDWQQQQQPLLLGHVFIELVSGWGFPSCCLLQLPTPTSNPSSNTSSSSSGQQSPASQPAYVPGSVVIRLLIPTAKPLLGFGQRNTGASNTASQTLQQQQQQSEEPPPLMLPGPAALQALLHELGHALSYLCPAVHLHTSGAETMHCQSSSNGTSSNFSLSSTDELAADSAAAAAAAGWETLLGPHCCCLLSGPAAGLDVRELSSHLFEHYARHPASLMVRQHRMRSYVTIEQMSWCRCWLSACYQQVYMCKRWCRVSCMCIPYMVAGCTC